MSEWRFKPKVYFGNELNHHGILGMKWGIRRYQDKAGKLTSAGKDRYGAGNGITLINHDRQGNEVNTADSRSFAPPPDMVKDCKEVNDGAKGHDYAMFRNQNCFYCSMAYELRQRGYDVQAKKALVGVSTEFVDQCFRGESYKTHAIRSDSELHIGLKKEEFNSLTKSICQESNNSRGMILVQWSAVEPGGQPRGGHAMNYEVRNGVFYLIDGQTGTITTGAEAYDYLQYANNIMTVRVDNVEIHPDAKEVLTEDDEKTIHKNVFKMGLDKATKAIDGMLAEVPSTLKKESKAVKEFAKDAGKTAAKTTKKAVKSASRFFKKIF